MKRRPMALRILNIDVDSWMPKEQPDVFETLYRRSSQMQHTPAQPISCIHIQGRRQVHRARLAPRLANTAADTSRMRVRMSSVIAGIEQALERLLIP